MVTLVSPGVSVSVIDESFNVSSGPGTVPLIIVATQQDKFDPSGSAIAEGTEKANAGKLYLITSQRELLQSFGNPYFASVGGTSKHGYALNEYGLLAAHSYLGLANRAYMIRADIDTAQLEPLDQPPVGEPAAGTYWLDLSETNIGLFVWDESTLTWNLQPISVIEDTDLLDNDGVPLPSAPGVIGSFTMVGGVVAGSSPGRKENQIFRRDSTEWVLLDTPFISENVIYRNHVQIPQQGELLDITLTAAGSDYVVNDTINLIDGNIGTGSVIKVTSVTSDVDAAVINAPGAGYSQSDVLIVSGGVFSSQATATVVDVSTIVGQDETDYAARFTAGTGHNPGDVITMDDGSTITVVTETAGVIDTFTVTTNSTSGLTEPATITQAGTTGTGVGFDMTLTVLNQEIYSVSLTTGGSYTTLPDPLTNVATTGGTGTGATVDLTVTAGGPVSTFTVLSRGTGYDGTGLTQTSTSGIGVGFEADATILADGDYWIKTTSPNSGTDFVVKLFDGNASQFIEVDAPLARTRNDALFLYGNNPQVGDLFTHYDMNNESVDPLNYGENSRAEFSLMRHNGQGSTVATGTVEAPEVTDATSMIINGVVVNFVNALNPGQPLPITDVPLQDTGVVGIINSAGIPNLVAKAGSNGELIMTLSNGKDITVIDAIGTPVAELGLSTEISITNGYVHSNWSYLSYEANLVEPVATTPNGTLWFNTTLKVDFLRNNGQGQWDEFSGDVFLQPTAPTVGISVNDLWIDTDQVDDYPVISRWNGTSWVELDNSDQTSVNGVLFRDARPIPTFGTDMGLNNGGLSGFPDLDADAPDPLLYPAGMMLWNTRYSTNNVKKWHTGYTFEGTLIGDRWVTESGNKADGSPYMGQNAVKQVIIVAMAAALAANEDIRAESIFYNIIVAPGFPEMIDEMITLNVDRLLTSFIIGDTPFKLGSSGTEIQNWATNFNGAVSNGNDGLISADTYLGMYYPSGLTTNLDGQEVVVPPSHIALRTYGFNDQVAYQWFAPAGYQRGVVTNAANVGFVSAEDEFVPVELNQGQRDVLYTNNINPIAFRPNKGLVVFGQKTRHPIGSALERINVVRLINYIRYVAPQLAEPFLFQPNDSITRAQVLSVFNRMLGELIVLRGLNDFLVVCDDSNNTNARIDRNELWIDIIIQPLRAIEFIYIPVRVRNTGSDLSLAN